MKIRFKIDRMNDGALVIYTNHDGKWVRQGSWADHENIVSLEGEIEVQEQVTHDASVNTECTQPERGHGGMWRSRY
jgi:hypothetical protein